ncbi:polysaccharide deacetylase family protein [Siminovitchia fortis]|uniref:polysaccharide deacetylase family protein n=1 Tax=Siminovitchia fortis TaxID=254758 RepID=UPI0013E29454|nr:polysaccharide deacetylase family protein [Siminovitchia fortis]WHY82215.1 polysaccharide deacetylase family protein [Siminovitchia fortis]
MIAKIIKGTIGLTEEQDDLEAIELLKHSLLRKSVCAFIILFLTGMIQLKVASAVATGASSPEDGYRVPILMYHAIDEYKGNGMKELYVTPENFGKQMLYLKSAGFTLITFEDLPHIGNIKKPIIITFDDGYKNNMNAYHILKKISDSSFKPKATIFMIGKKINSQSGLSVNELKEISDSGIISVQSHTETHPRLTETVNYTKELRDIKIKLEKITGRKVSTLAYPYGDYNDKVIEETKKYYQYAVTIKPGIANTAHSPYELRRIRINYSTSLTAFKNMVNP